MRKITFLLCLFSIGLFAQVPSYYNDVDYTKTGLALFDELAEKLDRTHSGLPYSSGSTDSWDVLNESDEDPSITSNVLLIYGYDDNDQEDANDRTRAESYCCGTVWNREHVYPQSIAVPKFSTSSVGPGTDIHNLKPCDPGYNSSRSNRKYTDSSGDSGKVGAYWYPGDEWKGDIARIIMYMYVRYDGNGSSVAQQMCLPKSIGVGNASSIDSNMVDLFLKWNAEDPVSDFEANRNEVIFGYQKNRNPFIDNPYLATVIWGGIAAQDKWNMNNGASDTEAPTAPSNVVISDITSETATVSWTAATDDTAVYDYNVYVDGNLTTSTVNTTASIDGLSSQTTYEITVSARDAAGNISDVSSTVSFTTLEGNTIIFGEDFENCNDIAFNFVSEASNKDWACQDTFGEDESGSAGMNGYQQNAESEDWMISKNKIDFDAQSGEVFGYYADARYGSSTIEFVYSSDYDGGSNPSNATWTRFPNTQPLVKSSSSGTEEKFSFSNIDISSISGNNYIACKYFTNQNAPTMWTVDNIEISTLPNLSIASQSLEGQVKVYPNPATSTVNIVAPVAFDTVSIYNVMGQLVAKINVSSTTINIDFLNSGSYIFRCTNEAGLFFNTTVVKQ
jgi:endonuclease I